MLCTFISDADPTAILLGSSPTLYRGISGLASNANNQVVVFLGNSEEAVVQLVLPDDSFARLSKANAIVVTIDSVAHHAALTAAGAQLPTLGGGAATELALTASFFFHQTVPQL